MSLTILWLLLLMAVFKRGESGSARYPDPRETPELCGASNSSSVCDPHSVLTNSERVSLTRIITNYVNSCQCGTSCARNESTVLLFVLPHLDNHGPANKPGDVRLGLARMAIRWRNNLSLDACCEDLLIFICKKDSNETNDDAKEIFISVGIAAQQYLTLSCISSLYKHAKLFLRAGNITAAMEAILNRARYIRQHEVPCRERSPYNRGGMSMEISLAIVGAVIIFSLVSCVLLSRLCRGMDSPLLARARLMIFHPDHDKQLLSQVYDSIQFNTDDFTMSPPHILPDAADIADGRTTSSAATKAASDAATTTREAAEKNRSGGQASSSRTDHVQLQPLGQDGSYKTFAADDCIANKAVA